MTISESAFESEEELQNWAFDNIESFLPGNKLIKGFKITTISGKSGIPDGVSFNFANREWYIIECELLKHGVWPHIAEQITRFVVALQNPETLKAIRNSIFDYVLNADLVSQMSKDLNTTPERLHQQVELFIEGVNPQISIFIDSTNRDLEDMAHALDIPIKIFRIQKFIVDGRPKYYSPEKHAPVIESEPGEEEAKSEFDIIELLGGGKRKDTIQRFRCYILQNGEIIYIKKSKIHKDQYYWYGISTSSLRYIDDYNVTHLVFVMGDFGFAKVPIHVVREFLKNTGTSKNSDGSIRHYHCLISNTPEPELYWSNDRPKFSLAEFFETFD